MPTIQPQTLHAYNTTTDPHAYNTTTDLHAYDKTTDPVSTLETGVSSMGSVQRREHSHGLHLEILYYDSH